MLTNDKLFFLIFGQTWYEFIFLSIKTQQLSMNFLELRYSRILSIIIMYLEL